MASEIEEIVETNSSPRSVNPHGDNFMKNDNYYSNSNSDDSNGNYDIKGEIDGNSNGERKEDNKKGGRKGPSTRVLFWRWLTTRRSEKNSNKKKDKKFDFKIKQRDNHSSNPLEQEFDLLLPDNLSQDEFQQSSVCKDFRARFEELHCPQKKCLSTFILFPENTVLKRSLLVYWWIAEGFLDNLKKEETADEDIANDILDVLTAKNFILPVYKHCQKVASSFRMHPHARSTVILLAKSADSTSNGNLLSWFGDRACLKKSGGKAVDNLEKVKTMLNISKGYLDCRLESFSKMKNVEVLYLGRWQNWDEHHHFDVTNSEFLKGLKTMEKLSFLSLQGVSGIPELPSSILNLTSLKILDLRACYNLEKLPKEIGSLKKLTHLDISECYLLDCMPRELLSLSELQVLKGFVITDTKNKSFCTLSELAGLKKLRKLSVNLNSVTFSMDKLSVVLKFKGLLKLKITWGGKVSKVKRNKNSKQENNEAKSKAPELNNINSFKRLGSAVREARSSGTKLEKLELQCLPNKALPGWVSPENLTSLKKLYIRGGGLRRLSTIDHQVGNQEWKVEVLRLKYLKEFKMEWTELMAMFPEMQYLEKFKCPKVTLFPCDCYGFWEKEPAALPQTTS